MCLSLTYTSETVFTRSVEYFISVLTSYVTVALDVLDADCILSICY